MAEVIQRASRILTWKKKKAKCKVAHILSLFVPYFVHLETASGAFSFRDMVKNKGLGLHSLKPDKCLGREAHETKYKYEIRGMLRFFL